MHGQLHLFFYRVDGNIKLVRDFFVGKPFLAGEVDFFAARGEGSNGFIQQLRVKPLLYRVIGIVWVNRFLRLQVGENLLFYQLFFETIVYIVTGEDKEVVGQICYISERCSFEPQLHEYFLYGFTGGIFIFEIQHGNIIHLFAVGVKDTRVGGLVTAGNLS